MKIIITGGAGYIGSHTAVEAIRAGHEVVILDSLINSSKENLERIRKASGTRPLFCEVSLLENPLDIYDTFGEHLFGADALIHFAALKSAPESVDNPLGYYRNNIDSLFSAIRISEILKIRNFIFSSSATVYGDPEFLPITEEHPIKRGNTPYGTTKVMGEWILEDATRIKQMKSVALRYFNPAGADWSLDIGEMPLGRPSNLVPVLTQTAAGVLEKLTITGTDFPTPDGSAIRDYIHVTDLAKAHLASLDWLRKQDYHTFGYFNLGTGKGTSVSEMVNLFDAEIAPGVLNYEEGPRRPGDAAEVWCDPSKAERILGWKAELGIKDILSSAWDWEKKIRGI
mgnify:CR=1 FL=1